jgi:metal-responsive CopG/Arc/MetJ family transcriptional regulator
MGRRRVKEKHIPMSLSVPYRLIQRVEEQLGYKQSRSKWVQGAIQAKLDMEIDWSLIESERLLRLLLARGIINLDTFKVMLRSVETEE